jgi:hypothetical protein
VAQRTQTDPVSIVEKMMPGWADWAAMGCTIGKWKKTDAIGKWPTTCFGYKNIFSIYKHIFQFANHFEFKSNLNFEWL